MSTTDTELKIDLDELDAKKVEIEAKKTANVAKPADIEVIKPETDAGGADRAILRPEEGLEKLKKQLEDEKAARIAADQRAQESQDAELRARTEVQGSQLDLVTNAIATVTQANDTLESRYAEALSTQDFPAAAKIQREMATNAARLMQLEAGKAQLEKAPKPTPRAPVDPVERFVSALSPRSATWVREHPDFVRDPKKNREMLAAHEIALARGHQADTDGYFESIERTLDIAEPTPGANGRGTTITIDPMADAAKAAPVQRRAAPAAAPVTRSGSGAGNRPNQVTLTAAEVEMAKLNDQTPEEYARNKIKLQREGRLN